MEIATAMINGVNVEALNATIEAVQQTPAIAQFKFRAANRWVDGGLNRSAIQTFYGVSQEDPSRKIPFVLDNDEPPVLLGTDKGANPVEYVLHALAGCITTTMVYHAAARGIELEGVKSRLEGDLDLQGFLGLNAKVRKGFQVIRIQFELKGDLTQAQKEELVAMGRQFSPVHEMISAAVPLEVSVA
jgi:uncharacterized OsmC-like protein